MTITYLFSISLLKVLDSASQGLLQSSLAADDPRKKLGPYEKVSG